jgi:hypothetical protein
LATPSWAGTDRAMGTAVVRPRGGSQTPYPEFPGKL